MQSILPGRQDLFDHIPLVSLLPLDSSAVEASVVVIDHVPFPSYCSPSPSPDFTFEFSAADESVPFSASPQPEPDFDSAAQLANAATSSPSPAYVFAVNPLSYSPLVPAYLFSETASYSTTPSPSLAESVPNRSFDTLPHALPRPVRLRDSTGLLSAKRRPDKLVWDEAMHELFVRAVDECGGPLSATPLAIRNRMVSAGARHWLTKSHISSHLQKHRRRLGLPTRPRPQPLRHPASLIWKTEVQPGVCIVEE